MPNANHARQRRKIVFLRPTVAGRNGLYLIHTAESHWRASLVPAAAVIPAPRAYINVVAVKKPVVGFEGIACSGCPRRGRRLTAAVAVAGFRPLR